MFKLLKKKRKKEAKNINLPEYHVVIKKYIAKNVQQVILTFDAMQDKTHDLNLVIKNIDYDFKEEVSLKESDVISDIKYRLNLLSKTKKEQKEIIGEKIEAQEQRIKEIETGKIRFNVTKDKDDKDIKENVNILDEKVMLRNYKVLLYCIENDGDGSYIEINEQGMKQVSYLYDDGILKPIFHVSKDERINLHPNEGANRKRFYSEQYLIDKEFQEDTNNLLGSKLDKILKIAVIIILALEIFAAVQLISGYKDYQKQIDDSFMNDMKRKAEGSSIDCAYWYSQVMKTNFNIVDEYYKELTNETESTKNKDEVINPITRLSNKLLAMGTG